IRPARRSRLELLIQTVRFLSLTVGMIVRKTMSETSELKRVRIYHLQQAKQRGERIAMLTAYDALTAQIFDEAGVDILLVGDSVGDNLLGHETTLPVTLDEMIPLTRGVSRAAKRSLVVADLPFGTYESSPQLAFDSRSEEHTSELQSRFDVVCCFLLEIKN